MIQAAFKIHEENRLKGPNEENVVKTFLDFFQEAHEKALTCTYTERY